MAEEPTLRLEGFEARRVVTNPLEACALPAGEYEMRCSGGSVERTGGIPDKTVMEFAKILCEQQAQDLASGAPRMAFLSRAHMIGWVQRQYPSLCPTLTGTIVPFAYVLNESGGRVLVPGTDKCEKQPLLDCSVYEPSEKKKDAN